jgi:hypothetical protein
VSAARAQEVSSERGCTDRHEQRDDQDEAEAIQHGRCLG